MGKHHAGGPLGFPRLGLIAETLLALLQNVVTKTFGPRQGHDRLVVLVANGKDVHDTGGEGTALGVLDVHDLEGTNMLLAAGDDTTTALVLTLGDNARRAHLELDHIRRFAGRDVDLKDVVVLGSGVGVPDGATIVGGDARNTLGTDTDSLDAAELVLLLLGERLVVETAASAQRLSPLL